MMRKAYVYKVNFMVEDDVDNLETQNKINSLVENLSKELSKLRAEHVSVQLSDISNNMNYGKCSDWRRDDSIIEFSNGALIDNEWYCDLCLPEDHENHF